LGKGSNHRGHVDYFGTVIPDFLIVFHCNLAIYATANGANTQIEKLQFLFGGGGGLPLLEGRDQVTGVIMIFFERTSLTS